MSTSITYKKLMQVLDSTIAIEDYMNAENRATLEEKEYGTLGDLRMIRDNVKRYMEYVADEIDRLKREVDHINSKDAKIAALLDGRGPSDDTEIQLFDHAQVHLYARKTVKPERFPVDDEHNAAA